jgi:hypothetical protein
MHLKLVAPNAILFAGFVLCTSSSYGTPEYSKKEKKACNYCHTKIVSDKTEMAKDLNDTGNCYKSNDHSLAKCASK